MFFKFFVREPPAVMHEVFSFLEFCTRVQKTKGGDWVCKPTKEI